MHKTLKFEDKVQESEDESTDEELEFLVEEDGHVCGTPLPKRSSEPSPATTPVKSLIKAAARKIRKAY